MRTLSDIPGLPEDLEELDNLETIYEYLRRPRSQSRGRSRSWRRPVSTYTEPRVILINTAPQHEFPCQSCCCSCHRSRCMLNPHSHDHETARSTISTAKRNVKRITFNPDPEMCFAEEPIRVDVHRPVPMCIPERIPNEMEEVSNKLPQ